MTSIAADPGILEREATTPLLQLQGITKRFGEMTALENVSLKVRAGEIHAILGENGAGKSTLMRVIAGITQPDHGSLYLEGDPLQFRSPQAAHEAGIAMVHQHFTLVPAFTVEENLALAAPAHRKASELSDPARPGKAGRYSHRTAAGPALEIARELGWNLETGVRVADMPVGIQQRVEIVKALALSSRICIFDEPTAVLAPGEVEELFGVLRRLKQRGCAVLLIAHKLAEILAVADYVTVLRHGRVVAQSPVGAVDAPRLASWMMGARPDTVVESTGNARAAVPAANTRTRVTDNIPTDEQHKAASALTDNAPASVSGNVYPPSYTTGTTSVPEKTPTSERYEAAAEADVNARVSEPPVPSVPLADNWRALMPAATGTLYSSSSEIGTPSEREKSPAGKRREAAAEADVNARGSEREKSPAGKRREAAAEADVNARGAVPEKLYSSSEIGTTSVPANTPVGERREAAAEADVNARGSVPTETPAGKRREAAASTDKMYSSSSEIGTPSERNETAADEPQGAAIMAGAGLQVNAPQVKGCPGTGLQVTGLQVKGDRGETAIRDLDLQIEPGSLFGIAGVDGNGQTELAEAIVGLRPIAGGRLCVNGGETASVAYIPPDRRRAGLAEEMSVEENLLFAAVRNRKNRLGPFLRRKKLHRIAAEMLRQFDIRVPGLRAAVATLSGGNQQKIVAARALSRTPNLVVAVNPTRGLDIGATRFIHERLRAAASEGAAVLVISTDFDEVATLADRTAVLAAGNLTAFDARAVSGQDVGLLLGGLTGAPKAKFAPANEAPSTLATSSKTGAPKAKLTPAYEAEAHD